MKKNIGITILVIIAFRLYSQNLVTTSACITNPPDFRRLSYKEASQVVEPEERKTICPEYLINLVAQLRSGQLSSNNKTLAIYLLGTFRPNDKNSIEVLIECIDFRASTFDPKTAPMRWGIYPAEEALIKIGQPAVNPILEHLPKETSELRRQLMCEILRKVIQTKP